MNSLGFGLERIGLAAVRRPLIFSVLIVLLLAISLPFLTMVKRDGSVISVIPHSAPAFLAYEQQKRDFRNFSRDIAVIVRSPRLTQPSGMEDLRFLQLELAISEGVTSARSVFSIPRSDPISGEFSPYFPDIISSEDEARSLIKRIIGEIPQAASLISTEHQTALIFVSLEAGMDGGSDEDAYEALRNLRSVTAEVVPEDFEIYYAGLTPIGLTIIEALLDDQIRLTFGGLLLGALIAVFVFRSFAAAFICAVPPILTAAWATSIFGLFNIPVTYLTTVLPTLALVLAYADGIVLYHRWHSANTNATSPDADLLKANLMEAVRRVGPASALTSITTVLAFSSFLLSSSEGLIQFAWLGMLMIIMAFVSVIVGLPVVCAWFIRFGWIKKGKPAGISFNPGIICTNLFARAPVLLSTLAFMVVIAFLYVHTLLKAEYRVTDYLPSNSETSTAEQIADEVFGGRSFMFFSVPLANGEGLSSRENRARISEFVSLLETEFDSTLIFSAQIFFDKLKSDKALDRALEQLEQAPDEVRHSYISQDNSKTLVSIRLPTSQSIIETGEQVFAIKTLLQPLEYSDEIVITGFPVLLAEEFDKLVYQLRTSLLLAIALAIVVLGVAARSVVLAIAAITPNLLPLLSIEFVLWLINGHINITEVVALTIAFGIAIDNAVHILNEFHSLKNEGEETQEAVFKAVRQVAPALGSGTLIICCSISVTLTSILPTITVIGLLIMVILVLALVSNLIFLPANILMLKRMFNKDGS